MDAAANRRRTTRVPSVFPATLYNDDHSASCEAIVRDISLDGVFVEVPWPWSMEHHGQLRIQLGHHQTGPTISLKVELVRETAGGLGLRTVQADMDSYHHLRRLVMYNAGTSEIEAEVKGHLGYGAEA